MNRPSRRRIWLCAGAPALTLVAIGIGCSAPAPTTSTSDPNASPTGSANAPPAASSADAGSTPVATFPSLHILPESSHSGFDGTHTYKVPIAVYGATSPKLVASDPSAVDIVATKLADTTGDDGVYFMVTAKKAGTVTLSAQAGGSTATATLTIAPYTADAYQVGAQRYTNGSSTEPACVACHAASGGIDHSPSRMASATDNDVISVITTGILVEGNPITQVRHKWTVSGAEATGLVEYLRALEPRGFVSSP